MTFEDHINVFIFSIAPQKKVVVIENIGDFE